MSKQVAPTFRGYVRKQPAPYSGWNWQTRMPAMPVRNNPHEGEAMSRAYAIERAISNASFWQPKK